MKRFIFTALLCIVVFTLHAQTKEGSTTVKINESATISLGLTYYRVLQYNATGITYQWRSSNNSVASVSYSSFQSCTVRGKVEGSCRVYFSASFYIDGFYRTYDFYWDVTVSGYTGGGSGGSVVNPTRAVISPTELTMYVGETYTMSAMVYPLNATYTSDWVIYSTQIATINQGGTVTAKSPGHCYIYYWCFDSKGNCSTSDLVPTCELTVLPNNVYSLETESSSITVERGETAQLTYIITPDNATNKTLSFYSSDTDIANVNSTGGVTGNSRGDCTITATTTDGSDLSVQWDVHVTATSTLNETATEIPMAKTDVDVTVNRTVKADEWNTICLPFSMSAEQVASAFGQDAQLGDFDGCILNDNGNSHNISVNFVETEAIEANHPYILKVSSEITQFTIEHVDVEPDVNPMTEKGGIVVAGEMLYDRFIGTYVANTIVPENALVLSGNKFWKSKGQTKTKALRGYFKLQESLVNNNQEVKLAFTSSDGITTDIEIIQPNNSPTNSNIIHTMDGRTVSMCGDGNQLVKGVYIIKGKKKIVR